MFAISCISLPLSMIPHKFWLVTFTMTNNMVALVIALILFNKDLGIAFLYSVDGEHFLRLLIWIGNQFHVPCPCTHSQEFQVKLWRTTEEIHYTYICCYLNQRNYLTGWNFIIRSINNIIDIPENWEIEEQKSPQMLHLQWRLQVRRSAFHQPLCYALSDIKIGTISSQLEFNSLKLRRDQYK